MGRVQGRVFDGSLGSFIADVAVSLSATNYALKSYVDGSLSLRDSSISDLDIYAQSLEDSIDLVKATYIPDVSLSGEFEWVNGQLEVSIGLEDYVPIQYVDGSLASRDISIAYLDSLTEDHTAHLNSIDSSIVDLDASIDTLEGLIIDLDSSISDLDTLTQTHTGEISGIDSSISDLDTLTQEHTDRLNSIDSSIVNIDSSVSDLDTLTQGLTEDVSLLWDYNDVQDSSILTALQAVGIYSYVDGSLAQRDVSIANLDASLALKANISDTYTRTYIDGSLNAKADLTAIPTDFYSQAYVDGSLGTLQGVNTAQDASIVILRNKDIDIDASIVALRTTNNNQDTSIGILNNWNVSQDASLVLKANSADVYSKTYIDGSLNAKQNTIPAGTYVKEASLGDGLEWNAGMLDVSIESITSMAELTDVSLVGLADKDTLVYNSASAVWENEFTIDISDLLPSYSLAYIDGSFAQRDTSIEDIYNTKQDIITDGTYVKEVSLGTDFVWNAGLLDVSIAAGVSSLSSLTDVSIIDVSEGNALIYTSSKWKNTPTEDIANVLVDISTIMVDFTSVAYTKTQIDASFATRQELIDGYISGGYNLDVAGMDASILKGKDASGNLMFKKLGGTGAIDIVEHDDYIDINIDASFSGEVNTASNIAGGIGLYKQKVLEDLQFKGLYTNTPSEIVISASDNVVIIDASIDTAGSMVALSDVSIVDVSTGAALMYDEDHWKNIPTSSIEDVLVDISTIMVEATSVFYTKTQIDASFASISHTHDQDASIANLYSLIQGSFSGTFTSDGSTITIENGLITGIV